MRARYYAFTALLALGACVGYNDSKPVRIDSAELQEIRADATTQIATWEDLAGHSGSCDGSLQANVIKAASAHQRTLRGYVEEIDSALAERQIVPAQMSTLRQRIDADREMAGQVAGMLRVECLT